MSNLADTVRDIEKWVFDNGLETESPNATLVEIFERLKFSVHDSNRQDTMIGIGNVGVLLITLAEQYGLSFEACLKRYFEVVKDQKL